MKMFREERIYFVEIIVKEFVILEEFVDVFDESFVWRRVIIIVNKGDVFGSKENYEKFVKVYGDCFKIVLVLVRRKINFDKLKDEFYELVGIIRVFIKSFGEEFVYLLVVFKKGLMVMDLVERIYKDFVKNFCYVRVWGKSVKFFG